MYKILRPDITIMNFQISSLYKSPRGYCCSNLLHYRFDFRKLNLKTYWREISSLGRCIYIYLQIIKNRRESTNLYIFCIQL